MKDKKEKKHYYAARNKFLHESKRLGHRLSLALTEEEDAFLWAKYSNVLKRWRKLKKPEGVVHNDDLPLRQTQHWKPLFNEDYVKLTQQLINLYKYRSGLPPGKQRAATDAKIRKKIEERKQVATYIDRETGEVMIWDKNY